MATYPVYPATTFTQAVELTIFASNQLHDVINGDALTTVETENGDIPTLRKALVDNFYFKTPIDWVQGESATVFNQLYYFDGSIATSGWYYAPQATLDNPVAMGSTPLDDDNWRLYKTATQSIPAQVYPWSTEITQVTSSIVPPYEFDTAIVTYNSAVLVPGKDYTIANNTLTFTPPLTPEPDAEVPDILFCYIGKVEEGNPNTNYVTYNSLLSSGGATIIGTSSGQTLQNLLDLGAAGVNLEQGNSVQDALSRVNILSFDADPTGVIDSSSAFRRARDYAVANNILEIYVPAGVYLCADYSEDIYLPRDDGTVYPAWIGVNGDVNIAAETQYKAKTFCKLPRGMRITGDGKHATHIKGDWNNTSSTIPTTIGDIPTTAGYGFFWTNGDNKSAVNGHSLIGLTISEYFVARSGDGIMVESFEDDLIIQDCYFSGIFQGAERCHSEWLEEKRVFAPTVVGGHWLQRNNTQTISQLPPYPATDAWLLGWCDAWTIGTHHHTQYQGSWGARHIAGDTFFDNMYFKSRNTATYANGGRLSNNSNNTVTIPSWYGVVGRARVLLSRYGRQVNSNGVRFFKELGSHRTPYYIANSGGNNPINDCFLEAIGLVDNRLSATSSNYFGITVVDPLNTTRTGIGYMVGEGGVQLFNYTTSARLQHAPLVSSTNRLYGSQQYVNFVPNSTDRYELERRSLWDGTNTTIKYLKYSDYQYSQPIAFSLGGEKLNYSVLSFTPGITIGGVANSSLTGTGYLIKTGRQLVIRCRFTASSVLDLPTGAVKITGLPYSIPNNIYGISFGFVYCPQLVNSISVFPRVGDVATEINLIKDSKGTALDGDDFSTTETIFLWVEMTATILE